VARRTTTPAAAPANGINYTANAAFRAGDSTGTGNYVVYKGAASAFTATSLALLTDYTYDVYEFNGKYMHVKFSAAASKNATTLPVQLLGFTAVPDKNDVALDWNTASEENSAGFVIERSADGKTFENIGFVASAGNSNVVRTYHYTDFRAFELSGSNTLYYRLRMQDRDKKESLSKVVSVTRSGNTLSAAEVYPNPFSSLVNINIGSSEEGAYLVEIADLQGKIVSTQQVEIRKGMNHIELNGLSDLGAGVYILKLTGKETLSVKLVKTN
jgi:hypothetical protein